MRARKTCQSGGNAIFYIPEIAKARVGLKTMLVEMIAFYPMDGVQGEFVGVLKIHFDFDVRSVGLNWFCRADMQFLGDLARPVTLTDELKNLQFAVTQKLLREGTAPPTCCWLLYGAFWRTSFRLSKFPPPECDGWLLKTSFRDFFSL